MLNSYTEQRDFLKLLLEELVDYIRYSNGYLFTLLKETTLNKIALIELDSVRLQIRATDENGYKLHLLTEISSDQVVFSTSGDQLRSIVNGETSLDKALAFNNIFVKGELADLLGIYRLVIGLLMEGPIDPGLRAVWNKFDKSWPHTNLPQSLSSLDQQQITDYFFFKTHPEEVALINIVL